MADAEHTSPLHSERTGPVSVLTLDHAPSRNALSEDMLAALLAAIDEASRTPAIKAVVLAANGPAFSAAGSAGTSAR